VFAAGAYEGKADMNGKSEWVKRGECIRITTRRRVSSSYTKEKERDRERERGRERYGGARSEKREAQAERVQRQVNRGAAGMACLQIV